MSLRGVRAVVTGASSGIGRAVAMRLAARGADPILVARRKDRLEEAAAEIAQRFGREAEVMALDLTAEGAAAELFERATHGGPVRMLVNNAGLSVFGPFLDHPWERHAAMLTLNTARLAELCHRFGQHFREQRVPAWILNLGSTSSFQPVPLMALYGGSKSLVRDFSEALAFELRDTEVHVTCLLPGATRTEFMEVAGQEMPPGSDRMLMDPEAVAETGLEALLAGRRSATPGGFNKAHELISQMAPRGIATWALGKVMQQARPGKGEF